MKVLSLKQPYAELVVSGKKPIEIRRWNTHFRGPFLIHASMTPDHEAMTRLGYDHLPLGMIVGQATLVDVKHYETKEEFQRDAAKHHATSIADYGEYGFILENAERLEKPIPAKGMLGFWEWEG